MSGGNAPADKSKGEEHAVPRGTNEWAWTLLYVVDGVEKAWTFQFPTANAALLFAAMNKALLK